jgi:acetylornithine/succinyldiaminopimelate/putrescine aminotransferase
MYLRRQFLEHIAQTSEIPQGFEIDHAEGCYLIDKKGDRYLDLVSGFGVNNIGHSIPTVIDAIKRQAEKYLHTNVYGEHVQNPQVELATYLSSLLPLSLNSHYFLNSGSECVDAAIKLVRLATGRSEIVVCKHAYHGSTIGAESIRSDEEHKSGFRPLIPGIRFIHFNDESDLQYITDKTAAVITEVVQAEAGVRIADDKYWKAVKKKCEEHKALLVFDEIQTGIGRAGKLFAFQHYDVVPDILLSGKALGAGMPLAAMICSRELMSCFNKQLPLGYITTFGGHPVSCAAGLAGLKFLMEEKLMDAVEEKAERIKKSLSHPATKEIRNIGLLMAVELDSSETVMQWIRKLYERKILAESFLFCTEALRVAPPVSILNSDLQETCQFINSLE